MEKLVLTEQEFQAKPALNPIFIDKDSLGKFSKISPAEIPQKEWFSLLWSLMWRECVIIFFTCVATVFIVGLIALGYNVYAQLLQISDYVVQNKLFLVSIVIFMAVFIASQLVFLHWILADSFGKYHLWLVEKIDDPPQNS